VAYIIAEIGINANGDIHKAIDLVRMAKRAGANAVKFQKRTIDKVYTKEFLDSPRESPWGTTQREQKEGLEFGVSEYDLIDAECRRLGLPWLASAWDLESLGFLDRYDLDYHKIASAFITHDEMLKAVAERGKHTFISTGMCKDLRPIDKAVDIFRAHKCPFTLLHCVSVYPCKSAFCNLMMIGVLMDTYQCDVGYSGHEVGLYPSLAAVAMGATTIERHITLDRAAYGSDQAASIEEPGLKKLVEASIEIEEALGDGLKGMIPGEFKTEASLRYWR